MLNSYLYFSGIRSSLQNTELIMKSFESKDDVIGIMYTPLVRV